MPVKILPVTSGTAPVVLAKGFPQRPVKQVRQDCAEAARQIEADEHTFDPTAAIVAAHRDLAVAKGAIADLRGHLSAARAAKACLQGEDYAPSTHPLVSAAEVLRVTSDESKAIDPHAGITDLSDTISALDLTISAMEQDLQVAVSNLAPAGAEFQRLLVAGIATGTASFQLLGKHVFDECEATMASMLPDSLIANLKAKGWSFPRGQWEPGHDPITARELAAACAAHVESQRTVKAQTRAARKAERLRDEAVSQAAKATMARVQMQEAAR